jgi:hypothetical protein
MCIYPFSSWQTWEEVMMSTTTTSVPARCLAILSQRSITHRSCPHKPTKPTKRRLRVLVVETHFGTRVAAVGEVEQEAMVPRAKAVPLALALVVPVVPVAVVTTVNTQPLCRL